MVIDLKDDNDIKLNKLNYSDVEKAQSESDEEYISNKSNKHTYKKHTEISEKPFLNLFQIILLCLMIGLFVYGIYVGSSNKITTEVPINVENPQTIQPSENIELSTLVTQATNTSKNILTSDNLISYWTFDEKGDGTYSYDFKNNFKSTHQYALRSDYGKNGRCMHYDGLGKDVTIIDHQSTFNNKDMSWSLWFKTESEQNPEEEQGIFWKAPDTGYDREIGISLTAKGYVFVSIANEKATKFIYNYVGNEDLYDSNWHNLVVTKTYSSTGDIFKTYIDGKLVNTITSTEHSIKNTNSIDLGRVSSKSTTARYFKGYLDEVSIWNKALTENEIQELFKV